MDRFHKGHCLVTLATGEIKDGEADRAGLVPTHAYAMLDIRQLKVQSTLVFMKSKIPHNLEMFVIFHLSILWVSQKVGIRFCVY